MWPRAVNASIGFWLMMSQFVFPRSGAFAWNELACGGLLFALSIVACWRPYRHALLAAAGVAIWVVLFSYFGFDHPRPPRAQAGILTGLVYLLFALIPFEPSRPPGSYRGPAIAASFPRTDTRKE